MRQYLFSVEPFDEAARYERSYALLPRGARNTITTPDSSRLLVASSSFGSSDLDALKSTLLDSITSTDVCSRVHDAYIVFQKTTSQILRSRGSTIATFTDQSKSVYDSYVGHASI